MNPVSASPATTSPAHTHTAVPDVEIRIYGHSNLFYWWPVWAVGFILALLTYLDGHVMAVVPAGTQVETAQVLPGHDDRPRDVLVAPAGTTVPQLPGARGDETQPRLRVAANNNYGVVFVGTLLLVIVITNFIQRGLASVIAVAGFVIVSLTLALLGWWDDILAWFGGFDIRMNAGGYMAISVPLFALWLFSTFVYDHLTYLVISRGQARVRQSIGDGEIAVDASGLLLEKKRDDLFRHWMLGLGSGDLHVKTGAPSNLNFDLPNVLLVGTKLSRIQNLLREKEIASEPTA